MVELSAATGFASGPRTGQVRSGRSPGSELPTPAEVERTGTAGLSVISHFSNRVRDPFGQAPCAHRPEPPGRDWERLRVPHPLCTVTAWSTRSRSVRVAPLPLSYRVERRDYSGWSMCLKYELSHTCCSMMNSNTPDYSDEPPSNRTSGRINGQRVPDQNRHFSNHSPPNRTCSFHRIRLSSG